MAASPLIAEGNCRWSVREVLAISGHCSSSNLPRSGKVVLREEDVAKDGNLDHFHWINAGAYLSVAEVMAIAREVWE